MAVKIRLLHRVKIRFKNEYDQLMNFPRSLPKEFDCKNKLHC